MIHYAFGALSGALYGALAVLAPATTAGRGLLFGTVLWATTDETMLPLLGLSTSPMQYPLSTHATALTGHLAYGLTAEAVRRVLDHGC